MLHPQLGSEGFGCSESISDKIAIGISKAYLRSEQKVSQEVDMAYVLFIYFLFQPIS